MDLCLCQLLKNRAIAKEYLNAEEMELQTKGKLMMKSLKNKSVNKRAWSGRDGVPPPHGFCGFISKKVYKVLGFLEEITYLRN